ncbi:threonine-phosphate decarboxylase CobD [Litoribacillus peritrichatus]|uniref:threonine-phosphate decarboxylase n=2 Tax=Litoribacillus peritrichatus TaxID=718191 RepID=A0ABP7MFB9_9GAMM
MGRLSRELLESSGFPVLSSAEHGGQLRKAADLFNIPLNDWLDLSTGINPNGYPVGHIPAEVWQRLPEENDGLELAASRYYQSEHFVALPGSQWLIQSLPSFINAGASKLKVGVFEPSYFEHAKAWRDSGHQLIPLKHDLPEDEIERLLIQLDVLVVVNPNNPTGRIFQKNTLLKWHAVLQQKGGYLVVDEAFMDADSTNSLVPDAHQAGLVVLRSLGKFFGLAGVRLGFVFAEQGLLTEVKNRLGPWSIAHPTRWAAKQALEDRGWQNTTRNTLKAESERLINFLEVAGLNASGATPLFVWVESPVATQWHQSLAQQGILVRLFVASSVSGSASLRFGLPADEQGWRRLESALDYSSNEIMKTNR